MMVELHKWLDYTKDYFEENLDWFSISYMWDGMYYTITYDYKTDEFTEEWHQA